MIPLRPSFRPLHRSSVLFPWRVLALSGLVLAGLAVEARGLRFEPRIDLLAPEDPLSIAEKARRDLFGRDFRILVALHKRQEEGGVLTAAGLDALEDLHGRLEAEPGIRLVSSLVNTPVLVATDEARVGEPLWAGHGPDAARTLLARLHASPLQELMLLSSRHSLTPLFLETGEGAEEPDLVRRVGRIAAEVETRHPDGGDVLVVGPAVVETSLGEHVFDDLYRLVPFAVTVMLLVLLAVVRRASLAAIAIAHSAALIAATLGGMAFFGVSVNLVSVLAPVLLIPIGIADLLHIFVRLEAGAGTVRTPEDRVRMVEGVFTSLEGAMVGTSATTAIGFLGFLLSPVAAIRQFGLTLSAGAVIAFLLTFTFDAALLSILWRPRARPPASLPLRAPLSERWLMKLTAPAGTLSRRSGRAVRVCLFLAAAGALSLLALTTDDTWIRNFDPGSAVARDARLFEEEFLGANVLSIVIEADPSDPASRAGALDLVNNLPVALIGVPGVRGTLSMTSLARMLDPVEMFSSPSWPVASMERLAAYREQWVRGGMPLPRASMLADPTLSRFQVLAFVLNDHYQELDRVVSMAGRLAHEIAARRVGVRFGGDLSANMKMVRLAVDGQMISLVALLAIMAALAVGFTRSPVAGLMIVAPMGIGVLTTYLAVVELGLPYGVAVSMFPTLMIGQAVDFGIHLRAALARNRNASRTLWVSDMAVVIRGILLNGALWTAGFAVLAFSKLPPNRYLGLLCSVVVVASTLITLLLLPTAALVVERTVPGQARGWIMAPPAVGPAAGSGSAPERSDL